MCLTLQSKLEKQLTECEQNLGKSISSVAGLEEERNRLKVSCVFCGINNKESNCTLTAENERCLQNITPLLFTLGRQHICTDTQTET